MFVIISTFLSSIWLGCPAAALRAAAGMSAVAEGDRRVAPAPSGGGGWGVGAGI